MDNALTQQGREQESGLIGAVLRRPALYDELTDITPDMFGWVAYRELWQAIANLKAAGMMIDTLTVGDELERAGKLSLFQMHDTAQFVGRAALSALKEEGDPQSAHSYAANVQDYHNKYKLLLKFQEGVYHASNGRKAADIIHDMTTFFGTIEVGGNDTIMDSKQAVSAAMEATDEASRGNLNVVPTGLIDLDKLLRGGAREGRLYIVAGRPGDGKSAFLKTIAHNAAKIGKEVAFISMEMSTTEQVNRLLAEISGIDAARIEAGQFTDDEWPIYHNAVGVAENLPIFWDDEPSLTLSQLRSKVRKMGDIDLLVVDSLNMMDSQMPHAKVFEQINALAYGLKKLSRELRVPIWVAHHTSKEGEKLQREPILADLEQAGEKPADLVAFVYKFKDDITGAMRRLKVAKHRGGPEGIVDLMFKAQQTKFENAVARSFSLRDKEVQDMPHYRKDTDE